MDSRERRVDPVGLVVAAALAVLAGIIVWDASNLKITATYGVGPEAMPIVVATGLGLLAVGNLVMALRGGLPEVEQPARLPILLILGGLVAVIALIRFDGGFVPAMAILFAATAAAFGRRALVADLVIGVVLGTLAYVLFAKILGLGLPTGPVERLIDGLWERLATLLVGG